MELDIIKTQTTWNDAAASLNSNFAKIKKGISEGTGASITVDDAVSDTSENAIQNKVIKRYVDDQGVYLEGYAEEMANAAEESAKKYTDEKIAVSPSGYATKEELENLADEMIDNERVNAAALNDLNSRIAALESIIAKLNNN